ncbi:10354_t:CDS:2, partial [Entrophospora sp. SA101]
SVNKIINDVHNFTSDSDTSSDNDSDNDIENNAIHGLSSDKPFDIQIPELSLEVILTESMLLYKKKDIIAIQEKLGIISNINQTAVTESKKSKNLAVSYELLLKLVGDLILIQEKLGIDVNPVLEVELRRDKASSDKPIRLFDLLLSLEDDIVVIQDKLGIIGYSNQERAEEVDENVRAQLQKLEEFHGPLEDDPGVILPKYGEMGVKKFRFTGEGLPLFPNLTPQQFHEIFVKKSASDNQCPCLEQVS